MSHPPFLVFGEGFRQLTAFELLAIANTKIQGIVQAVGCTIHRHGRGGLGIMCVMGPLSWLMALGSWIGCICLY
ncbi:hypothetical protein CLOP_g16416 [Closterium sp. NIES-67]|nr:hypothetical protein CLOP_g16416 [Closterium sp. NIES-67]